jgi:adenylate cyclase
VLGEQLVQEGTLKPEGLAQALADQQRHGGSLEDTLIRLKLVGERDVLRVLARFFKMQYLTTEKVAALKVRDELLDQVPVRFCEGHNMVPFRKDSDGILWVLAGEPIAVEGAAEIRQLTSARDVRAILVRAATLQAAIKRHYYRDPYAFETLDEVPVSRAVTADAPLPEVGSVKSEAPQREPSKVVRNVINDVAELKRENERLRVAQAFWVSIAQTHELGELIAKILAMLFDLFPADAGAFVLTDASGRPQMIEPRKRDGGSTADVVISQTLLTKVVTEGRGLLTSDAAADDRLSRAESVVLRNVHAAMCVPMPTQEKPIGVIYLETRNVGAFGMADLEMLSALGAQAAMAVQNALLAEQIEREVSTRVGLSRFLSPALVEQVASHALVLDKGGKLCQCTVMFADIRGFTGIAESRAPDQVVRFLNEHFEAMVDVVFARGGVLDKFIGDALMAIWGAPVQRSDDPSQAVLAAMEMTDACKQRRAAGFDAPEIGVGIATGSVVVGGIGSSKRLEYTAIGDAVNIASRLCDLAKAGEVLVAESAAALAGGAFEWEPALATPVKGKRLPVKVFKLKG